MIAPVFHLPEGFEPPESVEEGDVEVMATVRVLGGGKAKLVAIDGNRIADKRSFIEAVDDSLTGHGSGPVASN